MSNLTFLTREQCFESEKLDILQKRGTKAAITDFSILLGGWADSNKDYWHIDGDDSLEGRTGFYWTKSDDGDNDARVLTEVVVEVVAMFSNVVVGLAQLYRSHQSLVFPRTE